MGNNSQIFSLKKWILLTWSGWFVGVALVLGLSAVLEMLQAGKLLGDQSAVGIGMGFGVGLMQWIMLKNHLKSSQGWIWSSLIGFAIGYIAVDKYCSSLSLKPESYLPFATALGALITGLLQYFFILKKVSNSAMSWIWVSFFAWVVAHLMVQGLFLIDHKSLETYMPRILGIFITIFCILSGGPLLGYVTGKKIISILKDRI